jgi:hypothetical protein
MSRHASLVVRSRVDSSAGSPASGVVTPFLEISGIRPMLSIVATTSAGVQMYLAISSLYDSGCILIGSYVLSCGILSIVFLVALHLMPILFNRTHCALVAIRRVCWSFLLLLIPGFTAFNIVAALWIHSDNCWDRLLMRNLAIADIVATYIIILAAVWYVWENMVRQTDWWKKRISRNHRIAQVSTFVQRHARMMLLLLCLALMCGGLYKLHAYNDGQRTDDMPAKRTDRVQ